MVISSSGDKYIILIINFQLHRWFNLDQLSFGVY